jgi:hypothetical protein
MGYSQPLIDRRTIDPLPDRRSVDARRKVHDLEFFERGGIERRSGVECRQKVDRRNQCANASQRSTLCPNTKLPIE